MRFIFQFWRLEIATLQKYICEVDEERSGNVDVVVESIHCPIDGNFTQTSETSLFGNSAARPTESTALAMKESHLFPT